MTKAYKDFFRVWEKARDKYGLERKVVVNDDEAYIRIYQDKKVIVRSDGTWDNTDHVYEQAAKRLHDWLEQQNKNREKQ